MFLPMMKKILPVSPLTPSANNTRATADQFDPDPRLQSILDRLTTYYPRAIDPNLQRTFRLLNDLGNPHLSIPPAIHVGGTNGKGSVVAYLRAMSEAAGLRCHVMTSPHLINFNERIVIAGKEISNENLIALIEEVEAANGGQETTSFELITAAGFLAFSRTPADITLVEVGMGGTYDATNVIPKPLASIITVISRDHVKFLGDKLDDIAREKAGIIKPHTPCIVSPQIRAGLVAGVMDVFEDKAAEMSAPLYRHGIEWAYDVLPDSFILHTENGMTEFPKPNLIGFHQFGNAATAAMALLTVQHQIPVPLSAMEHGLTHAKWAGRLQRITKGALVDSLPPHIAPHVELWIDGGHNDSCGMVLRDQAKAWAAEDGKPLHLILGMLNTKAPKEFADFILPTVASAQAITIPDQPLSLTAEELAAELNIPPAASIETALKSISDTLSTSSSPSSSPCRILITGSLYLMGHILRGHS
jgi:dihydrofolate synthase/folylpolyglutamate synthase